jgi:hypothetical protein
MYTIRSINSICTISWPSKRTSIRPISSICTISCPSQRTHTLCVHTYVPDPYAIGPFSTDPYVPVKSQWSPLIPFVTPQSLWVRQSLLVLASYNHRLVPYINPSLFCVPLHLCTPPGKTFRMIIHPEIASGQTRLTLKFFTVRLLEKKVYFGGVSIISTLLSIKP